MPFYIYAWIGAFAGGLYVITAKLTSKHSIANPWLFNFLLSAASLAFTIIPAVYYQDFLPKNWTPIILASVFSTLFNVFYIFSNYNLDVSTFMPLFNFRGIFAVLIGIIFFGEVLTSYRLLFIGFIFIAGIFSSMDEKFDFKSFFKKTILIGLLSTFFLAVHNAYSKLALVDNDFWSTNLWIAILNLLMSILPIFLFKKELKKLNITHIFPFGVMGFFYAITSFAANKAYQGNLSISSLIMNMPFSMIFAFLFSIFAPKLLEKHTLKIYAIRFISTAVMIWAAMRLTS